MASRISKAEAERKARQRAQQNGTSYTAEYATVLSEFDVTASAPDYGSSSYGSSGDSGSSSYDSGGSSSCDSGGGY